jgi:PAS domain S-box-containing protein
LSNLMPPPTASVDFVSLFERSPNPYMVLDRDLRFVAANTAYLRLTASTLDGLRGRHLFDAFPHDPDDPGNESARMLRESFERVLATGETDVLALIPYRVPIERDGIIVVEERLWSATHTPILDTAGRVAFIMQHTVDVTRLHRRPPSSSVDPTLDSGPSIQAQAGVLGRAEHLQRANVRLDAEGQRLRGLIAEQKRLEAQLEALLDQQRFLAEAIPQQIWTATADGRLDFVNERVTAYFGATSDEILGAGWQAFIHDDDLPSVLDRWRACVQSGDTYEVEFRLRRADGVYRWHLGRGLAKRDAAGAVTRWFGTNTDLDDLKRAQDELQRRAEFDQQLIGIVSHDLRNPLNAIGMATSLLLKRGKLDDQQGKIVARIISSAERATRLIGDFLDFTQARAVGRLPIRPRPANIREIARQVFDEVHLFHADRPATIAHEGNETGVWDPDRIAQLVGNLVANAFQHGSADGGVHVRTRGTDTDVTIEVQNDGVPIEAAAMTRLFEPFERGVRASTSSGSSVGLGLFIARQIVAAHQGEIAVQSSEDTGTVFIVRLPRASV